MESLDNEGMNSFSQVTLMRALILRFLIINFGRARYDPDFYGIIVAAENFLFLKFTHLWSLLDPGWFATISSYIEPVHSRVQLQPIRASVIPLASWFSSRSTIRGYTATVDLCLKGSIDQFCYPSASLESNRCFQICSGTCRFVWIARASGLFTFASLSEALPKSLILGYWPLSA
ncbi:hypothetical protein RF11_08620 [Thelohanellus kitauei]|uniref:Uncharacterized protein n=1 Tax=Thelohanellus kitauei TaxID=669202 RepID=A0A0C2MSZ1_THEKT|nr:hypothetical protein RF11_08620 [Thelohanellus kitauei]